MSPPFDPEYEAERSARAASASDADARHLICDPAIHEHLDAAGRLVHLVGGLVDLAASKEDVVFVRRTLAQATAQLERVVLELEGIAASVSRG